MRMIFGLVLVVGLALAGFAVFVAKGYINQTEAALQQELRIKAKTGGLVEVFVARKPFNYGDVLTAADVQLMYWPKNSLPEGVFVEGEALFPNKGEKPRFVLRQMEQYEPILAVKVTEPGQPAGLTGQLDKGMRAFAIKVDVSSGVSGFVQPGDHVDIYWTGTVDGGIGDLTRLIESGVKIIAIDQTAENADGGATVARTVTVVATPEDVARLAQAQATGRLSLSLIGVGDVTENGLVEVDSNELLGIEERQVAKIEEEKVCSVKTRKGAEILETPIPCTN